MDINKRVIFSHLMVAQFQTQMLTFTIHSHDERNFLPPTTAALSTPQSSSKQWQCEKYFSSWRMLTLIGTYLCHQQSYNT